MKTIYLVCESFDKNDGQGVFKLAHYLYEGLSKYTKVEKIELEKSKNGIQRVYNLTRGALKKCVDKEGIYLFLCPEYSYASKFLKNSYVIVEDLLPILHEGERKKSFVMFWKYCWNIAKKQNIITISKETQGNILDNLYPNQYTTVLPDFIEDKIKNIYLGVDKELFKPIKKVTNKIFTVGYVGGFGNRKNVKFILEVARRLPKIKFKIAGKGGNYEELKSNAPKNIEFIGYIDEKNLGDYYNSLDLFLYPDLIDGWALPIVESMACGTPVLVHHTGVFYEVVNENNNMVADMENSKEVSSRILELSKDKMQLNNLKKDCLKRAKDFDWNKTIKEYYNFIIKKNKSM